MSGFVLDAYAARSCPVKTQNLFLPGLQRPEPVDESLEELFNGGQSFKQQMLGQLVELHGDRAVDCRPWRDRPWPEQVEVARQALAGGAPVVVSGALPWDWNGHRSGRADLWLRGPDHPDGAPGYYPAMVKLHRVLEKITPGPSHVPVPVSALSRPWLEEAQQIPGTALRTATREPDLLQLAHYWRLLEAAGCAAGGAPYGAIIATDSVPHLPGRHPVVWVRLDQKVIRTFSRTAAAGWTRRSALERYDHEHGFRVRVATIAQQQRGEPDDPALAVTPIRIRECDHCLWWQVCRPQLGDDDLSLRIPKSPLDVREIAVLRRLHVATLDDLATVDLDELLPQYLPEVGHRPGGEERIRVAAHRARMMVAGVELERVSEGPIDLPVADLEVDLDIETSAEDRVYLWGFLVTDSRTGGPPQYVSFSDFSPLTEKRERDLAHRALTWLQEKVASAIGQVRVYHYSSYEVMRIQRLAQVSPRPAFVWAAQLATTSFVDLFEVVRQHFFGVHGLGLKQVAQAGPGFTWRDDDPGGLNSQTWFAEAVHADRPEARAESRRRVLEYNEDDVRATHALRQWLRASQKP
ncbi:MAG: TM0106 family RecB-like putative nuclease [Actinomycetia bacterium]|nr:TM0106 family RecB-like putative nuclease [Actinomycetes bacterium]